MTYLRWLSAGICMAVGVSALAGCGNNCGRDEACAAPVSVSSLCAKSGACTLDGAIAPCVLDSCPILSPKRGQHVVAPLGGADLTRVPDLYVSYGGASSSDPNPVFPDPRAAIVLLDGVKGTPVTVSGVNVSTAAFVWPRFPAEPAELDFSYEDGNARVEAVLTFDNEKCVADDSCGG